MIKSSGKKRVFHTGAHRDDNKGKGRYDLLPPTAIRRLALRYEQGAVKYGDNNWRKGMPIPVLLDSALRHTFAALAGAVDEDHLAAAAWNICCAMETEAMIKAGILPKDLQK